jgi:hypothetical protein
MAGFEDDNFLLGIMEERIRRIQPVIPDYFLFLLGDYVQQSIGYKPVPLEGTLKMIKLKNRVPGGEEVYASEDTLVLETEIEPHYWFNTQKAVKMDLFKRGMRDECLHLIGTSLVVASLWEGLASGILPVFGEMVRKRGKDSVVLGVFPSKTQSPNALFNAYSSLGLCLHKYGEPVVILLDREHLEKYVGVHIGGEHLKGSDLMGYMVDLILSKTGFMRNLTAISQSFGIRFYTPLVASGASLSIYKDFRNILESLDWRPLFDSDLSTCSLVYALFRIPSSLEEVFSKNDLDLILNSWLKEKMDGEVSQISEVVYVDSFDERLDVLLLLGGSDLDDFFRSVESRVEALKERVIRQNLLDPEEWSRIRKVLGTGIHGVSE